MLKKDRSNIIGLPKKIGATFFSCFVFSRFCASRNGLPQHFFFVSQMARQLWPFLKLLEALERPAISPKCLPGGVAFFGAVGPSEGGERSGSSSGPGVFVWGCSKLATWIEGSRFLEGGGDFCWPFLHFGVIEINWKNQLRVEVVDKISRVK